MVESGLIGCYGGEVVLCSAWHVWYKSVFFTHL